MSWQDIVIAVGQVVFTLSLIPSIFSHRKPARWTCLLTAAFLFLFGGVYLSLALPWAAASVILCGILWSVLLFQKRIELHPFAWFDHFNGVFYRDEHDADMAQLGGNEVTPLFRQER